MTNQEAFEAMKKGVYSLASKDMKLEARHDALLALVLVLGEQLGFDRDQMEKKLADAEVLNYQRLLEKAEDSAPDVAAQLDGRPDMPDLPDEMPPP